MASGCRHTQPEEPLVAIQIQDRNGITETISSPDRLETYEMVNFTDAQPYKKVLRVYKKEGKNHSKITSYHANGNLWQYLEAKEMRAYGAYREWFPNGQQKIEAFVIGGTGDINWGAQNDWLFDGVSQVWNEQGELIASIPYLNGVLEGLSIYYYPNGQVEKSLPFTRNSLNGEALEYLPSGKLRAKTMYEQGMKHGLSLGFFQNAQASWIEEYKEDLIHTATYYSPGGTLVAEIDRGGGYQAVFDPETEKLVQIIEIRQGRAEGKIQTFAPTGELLCIYHVKNGKKQGEELEYYLTDEKEPRLPKLWLNWHENAIHGTVKTWYPNGKLQSQRDYCHNHKMGPALCWYEDGSLMMVEEYEEDRLVKGQYYKKNQREPVSSILNGNGVASIFDSNGIFLRKINYLKGKPVDPGD